MKYKIRRSTSRTSEEQQFPDVALEEARHELTEEGKTIRTYLRTAEKARQAENYAREAELLENAILLGRGGTPNTLRRYANALYRCGEYRAAALVLRDPKCREEGGDGYVTKLLETIASRGGNRFPEVAACLSVGAFLSTDVDAEGT
ncbi:MAG: hypothetical protein WBF53_06140 [Litorimonas sp.]